MIWRSTLVLLTGLTALALSIESSSAESISAVVAQSSLVEPDSAIDTGQTTPNFGGTNHSAQVNATSEQQIEEIKAIQRELKNRGYYDGPIDGIYGPITAEAIRVLRGQQEGNQSELTPRLFAPSAAPEQTSTLTEPEPDTALELDNNGSTVEPENNENPLNTTGSSSEAVNIGDEVSPEAGTDTSEKSLASPDIPEGHANKPSSPQQSSGLSNLLWPGLALFAALGSFGIGFILSNRVKTNINTEEDSPWGDVPEAVPQIEPSEFSNTTLNGHAATNGTNIDKPSDLVIHQAHHQNNDGLPALSTTNNISPTTRLAKVDVMDELVANLQVTDPAKRRKAIWELGQRGNSSAVQHLVNGMVDADSKEKSLILAALSEIGIRSLKPMNRALAIALQDDNPDVRKNAIRDLTRVYDLVTQISQMLGHATEDEDPEVRRTAEWALEQLNRIREAPKLKSSINTVDASHKPTELLPDEIENLKN
ncbi:MAG: hypothetical protein F6K11_02015 [Leptolyngbya sp. SIO3F4]|nr:hypothetical protein [Leptolyngbya sp. SIO3F4]